MIHWLERARASARRAAERSYPAEACGLLLGRRTATEIEVVDAAPARNLAHATDAFDVHPADVVAADDAARRAGLELVGVWHSHADAPAEPSKRDRAQAWPGWIQTIVAVERGRASVLRSFSVSAEHFDELEATP